MIYLTGDMHGEPEENLLNMEKFASSLSRKDILIQLGDFGIVWQDVPSDYERKVLHRLDGLPYTFCFIDGNHENFNRLNRYPEHIWNGGKVHHISDNVYHLMRGEIYDIPISSSASESPDTVSIFTFGGARSIDAQYRIQDYDWWEQEMPNYAEETYGIENLEKKGYSIDYILTHDAPAHIISQIGADFEIDSLRRYLEHINHLVSFEKWYFGHHHMNASFEQKRFQCLYRDAVPIG